jgi:hypothetical protein
MHADGYVLAKRGAALQRPTRTRGDVCICTAAARTLLVAWRRACLNIMLDSGRHGDGGSVQVSDRVPRCWPYSHRSAPLGTPPAKSKRQATTRSFFDAVGPAQLRYANLSLGTWLQWMEQERSSTHSMPRCGRPLFLCRVAAPRRNARHTAVERVDMH